MRVTQKLSLRSQASWVGGEERVGRDQSRPGCGTQGFPAGVGSLRRTSGLARCCSRDAPAPELPRKKRVEGQCPFIHSFGYSAVSLVPCFEGVPILGMGLVPLL